MTSHRSPRVGDGFLEGKRYLIMDRDAKFSAAFRDVLAQADVESVVLPPRSPNLNAHLERFFGSLKAECLDRQIFFGEDMLRRTVREYLQYYHEERNHQGLDNTIIAWRGSGPHDRFDRMSRAPRRCVALLLSPRSVSVCDRWFSERRGAIPRSHVEVSSIA